MYEIAEYTSVNNMGTAVLLEAMAERAKRRPFSRLVVASSMSLYGEGLYRAPDGTLVSDAERPREQLVAGDWETRDRRGRVLEPLPTPETKRRRSPACTRSASTTRSGCA
jgi:dTDP-L-rhamnose 4-epimerase